MGTLAGRFSNRYGGANSVVLGTCIVGVSLLLLLIPSFAVIFGLLGGVVRGSSLAEGPIPGGYTGGDVDSAFFWSPCSPKIRD